MSIIEVLLVALCLWRNHVSDSGRQLAIDQAQRMSRGARLEFSLH
jgi:hypothetical protein